MEPGLYVLTKDVVNPKPDRREKYDWRHEEVWQKGHLFAINSFDAYSTEMHSVSGQDCYSSHILSIKDSRVSDLIKALKPVPVTTVELLFKHSIHVSGSEHVALSDGIPTLQVLVNQGKITLEDISQALTIAVRD